MLSREKIVVPPFIHGIFSKLKAEAEEICCYVLNSWPFAKNERAKTNVHYQKTD